jgi:uncharacterized pyridoxamine 5'-phosphate oxidase family protein
MREVIQFLLDNKVFFLATAEGDQPKVRPLGFVMEYDGKLCFCTNNRKDMFRQMKANPKVEICASAPDGQVLRITGKAGFLSDRNARVKALELMLMLKGMYSADDGIFEIFCVEKAVAVFDNLQGDKREVRIS